MSQFLPVLIFCLLLGGCMSGADTGDIPKWEDVTIGQFRREVEESRPREIWNYAGSSNSHHYFYREPGEISLSTRQRIYRKIPKADVQGIPRGQEMPFIGKAVSRSFAFTQMAKDRSGFTHSLSRGLVNNVLKPSP